jgi:D-alanyl-lipoteichoic acid acyltransferase DltB (MBOAT superfamily)
MSFISLEYFVFLPIAFLLYYAIKEKYRWAIALTASYVFFAFFKAPQAIVALALITITSFYFGLQFESKKFSSRSRLFILWIGIGICIVILVIIKYIPSFLPSLTPESPYAFLLNSIGVSYFTFQAISYMADVYLEKQAAEQHFGIYALSLAFFPKIAQGPIERANDILLQIHNPKAISYDSLRSGILLFGFGLAKKLIIADRIALYVNTIYDNVKIYTGLPILLATYGYALQIYFDFSGYTDMARGSARLFGIELSKNFNSPYMAISIPEFWRRWHISFSRWMLDYIFRPLQMVYRDLENYGTAIAIFITFLISGIWHGAKAGFIVWGALHGIYLAASVFYSPFRKKMYKRLKIENSKIAILWRRFFTFNLVCFAWIFFRANTLNDAFYIIAHIVDVKGTLSILQRIGFSKYFNRFVMLINNGKINSPPIIIFAIIIYYIIHLHGFSMLAKMPTLIRWCLYYIIVLILFMFAAPNTQFIYFKF